MTIYFVISLLYFSTIIIHLFLFYYFFYAIPVCRRQCKSIWLLLSTCTYPALELQYTRHSDRSFYLQHKMSLLDPQGHWKHTFHCPNKIHTALHVSKSSFPMPLGRFLSHEPEQQTSKYDFVQLSHLVYESSKYSQARFRRRTFHEPNLIH